MEYVDYMLEPEDTGSELDQWGRIESLLEETVESDKQRIRERIEKVYNELESRRVIHEENLEELEQRIREEENRLDESQSQEEEPIRENLKQLRNAKIRERKEYWRDVQELKTELRNLLEKLDEMDSAQALPDF